MNFPRVLIIGQVFDNHTGSGITLTNLFLNWPLENIAVISGNMNEDWSICGLQYVIGYDEIAKQWPVSLLQERTPSTIIRKEKKSTPGSEDSYINTFSKGKKLTLKQIFITSIKDVLNYAGIRLFFNRTKLSPKLSQFIEDFKPELIYTQLSSLDLIDFVGEIHEKYSTPIAIHIMDDWPVMVHKTGLLGFYWNIKTNKAFRILINKASVFLTISDAMSKEYNRRYGKNWIAFHNPVNPEILSKEILKNDKSPSCFKIMYRGRIGSGINKSLVCLIRNIETLVNSGQNIKIQLGIREEEFKTMRLDQYKCTELLPQLPYKEVYLSLASADLLVIIYDFDKKSREYMKFSMPTKATEYMASGVSILVFAPSENAVSKYAREENWGYVVDKDENKLIQEGIMELLNNQELRTRLIDNARKTVLKNHDAEKIREKFRQELSLNKKGLEQSQK
jgi:glycosyltransferase involved in cell wall biosynthesis